MRPNNLKWFISEIRRLRDSAEYEASLDMSSKAIEAFPDRYEPFQERGTVYEAMGDIARALADADTAVNLAAGDAAPLFVRGQRRLEAHLYNEALADLDAVVSIENATNDPYLSRSAEMMRALCFVNLKRFEEAREICRRLRDGKWFVLGSLYTVDRIAALAGDDDERP